MQVWRHTHIKRAVQLRRPHHQNRPDRRRHRVPLDLGRHPAAVLQRRLEVWRVGPLLVCLHSSAPGIMLQLCYLMPLRLCHLMHIGLPRMTIRALVQLGVRPSCLPPDKTGCPCCRYASGATVQIILFGILAVEVKRKAPKAHTILECVCSSSGPYRPSFCGSAMCAAAVHA
jgi:hypothetical protein